jgi:hypothetical protein
MPIQLKTEIPGQSVVRTPLILPCDGIQAKWSTFVEPDPQPNYWIDTLDAEARSSVLRVLRFFRLITSAYKADIVDHGMAKELFGVSYSRWVDRFMKPQLQLFDLAMLDESNYRVDDKYLFVPSDWLSKP